MHPRDIFIRHLNTLRLYVEAEEISIFHQQLNTALGSEDQSDSSFGISVEKTGLLEETDAAKFKEQGADLNQQNVVYINQHDKNTFFVQLNQNMGIVPDNVQATTSKTLVPRKSAKAEINPAQFYWLRLEYKDACPEWLNDAEIKLSKEQPSSKLSHLFRLLESTNLLLNIALEYIDLSSDPLTMLCSRSILQTKLSALCKTDNVGLIMLHCTDFNQINKKFSHEHGDVVIREIANSLKPITRESDILSRFSGALFGIGFSVSEQEDVTLFAQKLQLALQHNQYLHGAINLTFNIGAATIKRDEVFKSDSERVSNLFDRADQALTSAQQEKVPSIIIWNNDDFSLHQQQFNYLGGIFTADTVTDYRNMLLLWDISSLIADKLEFSNLLRSVVQRLAQTFEFLCAGVISNAETTEAELLFSINFEDNAVAFNEQHLPLKTTLHQMQTSVLSSNKPLEQFVDDKILLVIPMKIDSPDCFFISGDAEKFKVTHDTKVLLTGLIRQLGKALRRSRLEEELNRKLETQNEQLQNELATLKEGIQESSIVFQSTIMQNLLKHTKRAAATDTTVLVTGESGTGKERLIHALHTLGPRADKPFVIVDCGSIPETLIESELFGHVKGAFTGAQNSSKGKVTDADGGVLVLDEIGELPLNMQTKLLRFVQEKHYTPVGGNKLLHVDVKIIAVTNRNLAEEVENGSFRRDLYYRLNVLTLHNPPLRQRSEDIPLLSKHFLNKFAEQFNTTKKSLSKNAMQNMQQYPWPGNIRELENRLMQATLMCEGDMIEWDLLNIDQQDSQLKTFATSNTELPAKNIINVASQDVNDNSQILTESNTPRLPNSPAVEVFDKQSALRNVQQVLADCFSANQQLPQFVNSPVGSWIEDDLILQTFIQSGEKMRTTAARLQISQSKARRRVDKILALQSTEPPYRPPNWTNIEQALLPIANGSVVIIDCLNEIKLCVMKVILEVGAFNMAQAAEVLGVSEPTFYKLKKSLDSKAT